MEGLLYLEWFRTIKRGLILLLTLLFRVSPFMTITIIITSAISAVIPIVLLHVGRSLLEFISGEYRNSGIDGERYIIVALAAFLLLRILVNGVNMFVDLAASRFHDQLSLEIDLILMNKTVSLADISHLDRADFFDDFRRLSLEAPDLPRVFVDQLGNAARGLILFMGYVAICWSIDPLIAISCALVSIPSILYEKRMLQNKWLLDESINSIRREQSNIKNIAVTRPYAKEVRLFGAADWIRSKYLQVCDEAEYTFMSTYLAFLKKSYLGQVIKILGLVPSLFHLLSIYIDGRITMGSLVVCMTAIRNLPDSISGSISAMYGMGHIFRMTDKLDTFLQTKPRIIIEEPGQVITSSPIEVTFENVSFIYPGSRSEALRDVSFHIRAGECVGIRGENGSGKSTIANLILRLYDPTLGRIYINGVDLHKYNVHNLRRTIAVMLQRFGRYELSLANNVNFDRLSDSDTYEIVRRAGLSNVFTSQVELATTVGKLFGERELSGGEWQRVAFGRFLARARDAGLLILDEPCASIDPEFRAKLVESILGLKGEKTVILVSHSNALLESCDRIITIHDGRLMEATSVGISVAGHNNR